LTAEARSSPPIDQPESEPIVSVPPRDTVALADQLAAAVRASPPSIGITRLVAVDGLSGSGKTTVADALAQALDAPVLHLDDLYEGWDGLDGAADLVRDWVVTPLRAGRTPRWHPYDWATGERAPARELPVADVLVVEGCGAGARRLAGDLALLIWVSAGREREARLQARPDWPGYREHRERWARQEHAMLRRERTPARADVTVRTGDPPAVHRRPAVPTLL
jgi:hypothetical protein